MLNVLVDCSRQILTPPDVSDKLYIVNEPLTGSTVAEFGNDEDKYCPLTYTLQTKDSLPAWIQWDPKAASRQVNWYTTDESQFGIYMITLAATGPEAITAELTYQLIVKRPCIDAVLQIQTGAITEHSDYIIEDPTLEIKVDRLKVVSDQNTKQCTQDLLLKAMYKNGTAIDSEIMQWSDNDWSLKVQSDDYDKYLK